jgi:hypothetical protein
MDKELYTKYINDQYDYIIKKVAGSVLYGELVDITNIKQLVVVAYCLGANTSFSFEGD